MKFRPLNDLILVRLEKQAGATDSGIILLEDENARPTKGEVVAVGPGSWQDNNTRSEMPVSENDQVLFPSVAGFEVKYDDDGKYKLMKVDEILGIIRDICA